ncbi:MAG TPA: hypothetical protein VLT15_01200 [Acidimicrobiia bacterium]|nr:hypothetical protein [Acidimicrobiia bacterium]
MRKANLLRSIARFLDDGTYVIDAAYMWRRHRLMLPFGIASFVGMVIVAEWVGWEDWATRVVIGLAGAALAVAASTDYKVVALTSTGVILLQASRIRQAATRMIEKLPADVAIEPVGGTVLAADWEIAGSVYTVPRSSEQAINRIAGRAGP